MQWISRTEKNESAVAETYFLKAFFFAPVMWRHSKRKVLINFKLDSECGR